ncbi:MAG: type II toxin-antitoxin system HicB family antitoxin [Patescibacteria group bacterium]
MTGPTWKIISGYDVMFEPSEAGGYAVHVPKLPGCHTQGETLKEAEKYAKEAIKGHLLTLEERGDETENAIVISVPTHSQYLKPETVKGIIEDAGITEEEFMKFL